MKIIEGAPKYRNSAWTFRWLGKTDQRSKGGFK